MAAEPPAPTLEMSISHGGWRGDATGAREAPKGGTNTNGGMTGVLGEDANPLARR